MFLRRFCPRGRVLGIALIAVALAGCATRKPPQHAAPPAINDIYVVHLVVDGLNEAALDDALARNLMPSFSQHFVDAGARIAPAVTTFPSSSPTAYQSFMTGLHPGNAGIPHLERFDRQRHRVIGYLDPGETLAINDDLINMRALEDPDAATLTPPTSLFQ